MIIKSTTIDDYLTLIYSFNNLMLTEIDDKKKDYFVKQLFGLDSSYELVDIDDLKILLFMGIEKRYEMLNDLQLDPIQKEDSYYIPDCWVSKFNSEGINIQGNVINLFLH